MKHIVLNILAVIILVVGIIYLVVNPSEPFVDGACPTTMIKNGQQIMIYDPSKAKIPGVNPIMLNNLEEYKEYVAWQKKSNLDCPILFLEKVFNAPGDEMYQIRPSFDTDIPYGAMNHSMPRKDHITGYDKDNQTIGDRK